MVFSLTDEQLALRHAVADLMAKRSTETHVRALMATDTGFDPAVWQELAAMGLLGLLIPEQYGGAGAGAVEVGIVAEELGRTLFAGPFLSTAVLVPNLLAEAGDTGEAAAVLPRIAAGELIATIAVAEDGSARLPASIATSANAVGEIWQVTGTKHFVLDGQAAGLIYVLANTDTGPAVLAVEAGVPGLEVMPLTTVDQTRKQCRLQFVDTPARLIGNLGCGVEVFTAALDSSAVALISGQAGGARRAMEMACEYAKTRYQFARAIGSFQAVKHMCADMLLEAESAVSAARFVAAAFAGQSPTRLADLALAQAYCSEAYVFVAATNIQAHGGIGFTWEHPAHLYLRRARSDAQLLGSPSWHRERYLAQIGAGVVTRAGDDAARSDAEERRLTDDELRAEVADWLAANWSAGVDRTVFAQAVVDTGWAVPSWEPQWYGRGLSDHQSRIVAAEFNAADAPGSGHDRANLFACTVHDCGTDEQKRRLIPASIRGESKWCLLYSEPGAGSDLAGLRTRADRDGDDWIINGQKVWTSFAVTADYGMLVARTDWDMPKHNGISLFMMPMRQPGVEIRPIHQITGESEFNEVFIENARVPGDNLIGGPGDGWSVLQVALGYERLLMGDLARTSKGSRRLQPEKANHLVGLARAAGRLDDSYIRQQIARVDALATVNRWNTQRSKAATDRAEAATLTALGKIAMSRILHETARVETEIVGAEAMLAGPENPVGDAVTFRTLNAYFTSIGGGTDQIQRNIIGERVLGLPKEPDPYRNTPFRDLPH